MKITIAIEILDDEDSFVCNGEYAIGPSQSFTVQLRSIIALRCVFFYFTTCLARKVSGMHSAK